MNRKMLAFVLAIIVAVSSRNVEAQTVDDTGLWFAALGNGSFDSLPAESPVLWWFDAHYRLRDDSGGFNQSIVRPGLGLQVTDDQALWAGYAWVRTSPITGLPDFDEHRFWQQWTAAISDDDLRWLHRSRFEQRWFETGDDVALRWRQMIRSQKILAQCPQWSLIAWDEVFFDLNDTDVGTQAGLDQNRVFLGVGYKRCANGPVRTEVGYLNQFINSQGREDSMNHILSVNFFF